MGGGVERERKKRPIRAGGRARAGPAGERLSRWEGVGGGRKGAARCPLAAREGKGGGGGQTAVSLPSSQRVSSPPPLGPSPTQRSSRCRHESSWWRKPRLSMEHFCRLHGLAIFWGRGPKSPPARLPSASRARQRARAARGRAATLPATARTKVGGLWFTWQS